MIKKLFCVLLVATFVLSTSLYSQDKDAPKEKDKDKAAAADKDKAAAADKDKAPAADKDKAPAADKDKGASNVKEVVLPIETRIKIGDYLVNPNVFYITGACLVAIVGVWYTLLRKKSTDESGSPPPV